VLQLTQPLGLPRYVKGSSRARWDDGRIRRIDRL